MIMKKLAAQPANGYEMCPDMRRPPPGGRAGVVPTADSGGEEPDRVSTVANDP
jgi:hypothetical protein